MQKYSNLPETQKKRYQKEAQLRKKQMNEKYKAFLKKWNISKK